MPGRCGAEPRGGWWWAAGPPPRLHAEPARATTARASTLQGALAARPADSARRTTIAALRTPNPTKVTRSPTARFPCWGGKAPATRRNPRRCRTVRGGPPRLRRASGLATGHAHRATPHGAPRRAGDADGRGGAAYDRLRGRRPGTPMQIRRRVHLQEEGERQDADGPFQKPRHGTAHSPLTVMSPTALTATEVGSSLLAPCGGANVKRAASIRGAMFQFLSCSV